jgi:hypothetical protein
MATINISRREAPRGLGPSSLVAHCVPRRRLHSPVDVNRVGRSRGSSTGPGAIAACEHARDPLQVLSIRRLKDCDKSSGLAIRGFTDRRAQPANASKEPGSHQDAEPIACDLLMASSDSSYRQTAENTSRLLYTIAHDVRRWNASTSFFEQRPDGSLDWRGGVLGRGLES